MPSKFLYKVFSANIIKRYFHLFISFPVTVCHHVFLTFGFF